MGNAFSLTSSSHADETGARIKTYTCDRPSVDFVRRWDIPVRLGKPGVSALGYLFTGEVPKMVAFNQSVHVLLVQLTTPFVAVKVE
jgi:hypothetical protein